MGSCCQQASTMDQNKLLVIEFSVENILCCTGCVVSSLNMGVCRFIGDDPTHLTCFCKYLIIAQELSTTLATGEY